MKNILSILISLLLISCSAQIEKQSEPVKVELTKKQIKQREFAKQLFIDAALLDVEGKYAEAILDYQEALKLDPSAGIYYSLGKDYLRLQKIIPALENTRKAVSIENENIEYLTLLGTIYSMSRKADSAVVVFNRIIGIDSTDINAQFHLAQLYEAKKPIKSLETYNKLLKLTGPEWNVLLKIAELNERLGKVDKTISTVEELLELNPSNLQLQKLLIESYLKNAKSEKALVLVNSALEIFPDDYSLIELKGNSLVKLKKWEEGAEQYKLIIQNDKISFSNKMNIGTAFYSEALNDSNLISYAEEILQLIEKDSSDWQINAFLGELANNRGEDSLTIYHFRKAINSSKLNTDLRIRFGQILFGASDFINAAIEMEEAVKKFPQNHVINLILGLSLAQMADHNEALQYLKKSVDLNPNDLHSTLAYSFSLNQIPMQDEALIYLNRALRIDPKNLQALGMMGLIYDNKQMFTKSDSIYSRAIQIDSTNILILNNFSYSLAERGMHLEKALKMVKRAIEQEPENSSYLDTIGWVYYRMGRYEEAKVNIIKAIEFDKENATLFDHLGDVHYKLNNKEEAIESWETALKLDSTMIKLKIKIKEGIE